MGQPSDQPSESKKYGYDEKVSWRFLKSGFFFLTKRRRDNIVKILGNEAE